jgi:hypothetical protein
MTGIQDQAINAFNYRNYVLNGPLVTTDVQKSGCGKKTYDIIRLLVSGMKTRAL